MLFDCTSSPGKTREVKFTRVYSVRKAREILRSAMFVTSLMEQSLLRIAFDKLVQYCLNKLATS